MTSDAPPEKPLLTNEAAVAELVDALGTREVERIEQALANLGLSHDNSLYKRVGEMARSLHESLSEFQKSLSVHNVTMSSTTIPDAVTKLEAVLQMTFEAVEQTLGCTERQAELLMTSAEQLAALESKITEKQTPPEKLEEDFKSFIHRERERVSESIDLNNRILLAQEFQDLSGQSIKKVIKLVSGLEANLISLVQLFGADAGSEPKSKAEPEQTKDPLRQDDVDDVLKSFGF